MFCLQKYLISVIIINENVKLSNETSILFNIFIGYHSSLAGKGILVGFKMLLRGRWFYLALCGASSGK
jgi:UDP-3-O-[3-hydroxymyristoyl] glucosamine N-acyltransferase